MSRASEYPWPTVSSRRTFCRTSMKRAAAIVALLGIVLAVPVKQPRRHHVSNIEKRAGNESRLIASISTPRGPNPRFEDARGLGGAIVAANVGKSSDDTFAKRGKLTRHRRPKFIEEKQFIIFTIDFTAHEIVRAPATVIRRSDAAPTAWGSVVRHVLPRPRESLLGPSSWSGVLTV